MKAAKEKKQSLWSVIYEDDLEDTKMDPAISLEKMRQTYLAMKEAYAVYDPNRMSASGLVGDAGERMAKAVEAGGVDAVSLINTLTGMKIDINRRQFVIANKTGGVSGPAIHPIAVRMVYQVANAINLPIIGMGGIASAEDAIEMILAGASAVSVGTANFHDPAITMKVVDGIEAYMKKYGFNTVQEMVGLVK